MVHRRAVVRFVWTLLVVAAAQVAALSNTLAFEESRSEYGARLRLTSLPVRVRLDTPVPGFFDGGRAALLRAIATWNARACSSPLLVMTEDEDDVLIEIVPILEHWRFGSAIAAHTAVESDPFQGDIRHVVIELDARRTWSQEPTITSNAIDLESVFLHEIGHALGLEHSRNQDAVMRAGLQLGETRRVLHDDDVAGICAMTKATLFGGSSSMSHIGLTLWRSKWLFVMTLLFVIGICIVASAFIRRTIRRHSTCVAR
jgi:hypothetical protein